MVWDPFRGRSPCTIRFCTILVHCGAALIVVGCLGVLIVPTALTLLWDSSLQSIEPEG